MEQAVFEVGKAYISNEKDGFRRLKCVERTTRSVSFEDIETQEEEGHIITVRDTGVEATDWVRADSLDDVFCQKKLIADKLASGIVEFLKGLLRLNALYPERNIDETELGIVENIDALADMLNNLDDYDKQEHEKEER